VLTGFRSIEVGLQIRRRERVAPEVHRFPPSAALRKGLHPEALPKVRGTLTHGREAVKRKVPDIEGQRMGNPGYWGGDV
jgi:hypothetical protein